jgi:hypothetical protein
MWKDRRTVLQMVALGRMTAAEAERMLMLWSTEREDLCVIAGCMVLAVLGELHGRAGTSGAAPSMAALHHAVSTIHQWLGGKQ